MALIPHIHIFVSLAVPVTLTSLLPLHINCLLVHPFVSSLVILPIIRGIDVSTFIPTGSSSPVTWCLMNPCSLSPRCRHPLRTQPRLIFWMTMTLPLCLLGLVLWLQVHLLEPHSRSLSSLAPVWAARRPPVVLLVSPAQHRPRLSAPLAQAPPASLLPLVTYRLRLLPAEAPLPRRSSRPPPLPLLAPHHRPLPPGGSHGLHSPSGDRPCGERPRHAYSRQIRLHPTCGPPEPACRPNCPTTGFLTCGSC
jgi:hypothetical protein